MAKFKAHLYETEHSGFYDNNDVKHIPYFLPSAWTTFTPEQITTATFNMVPKTWTKFTVTDGDWMTKNTLIPLSSRDLYLADLLDNLNPKIKTFIPGNHTTITTDARGFKYINQYYNAEDFKHEFNCDQGTIDITFSDDKKYAYLKIKEGTHDLSNDQSCQDWYFTDTIFGLWSNYLSADKAQFVSLSSQQSVNTNLSGVNFNVDTLTGVTITSIRTSATNLYSKDFITTNDFKVSDNFSAMTAYFSGAGDSNKSLCLNGSANNLTAKNDFKIQQNLTINYLSATETAIATAVQNTEGVFNSAHFDNLNVNYLSANNTEAYNTITANRLVTNSGIANNKIKCQNATESYLVKSTKLEVTGTSYNAFTVKSDFKVYPTSGVQQTSLSGILTNIKNAQIKNTVGIIAYEPGTVNTILYYNKNIPEGAATEYNSTNLNNLIKNENLNTIIFRLGNLSRTTNVILPINVSMCKPTLTYHINLVVFDNHQKNRFIVRFFDTVKSNFYFYNAPKTVRSFGTYYIDPVVWPTKESESPDMSPVINFFTNVPANGSVYAMYGSSLYSDWECAEHPDSNWLDDFAKYNKVWGVLNKNIMFKVVNTDDGHFIYFLNGNNY